MPTCKLEETDLHWRFQTLEKKISYVRKTKESTTFANLIFPAEVSLIRQAKWEHHPVRAKFSGKAFMNLDAEYLFLALQDKIIDALIEDTPFLTSFIEEAIETFTCIAC
ncbi:MAG: hypothetical protein QNJ27_04535 [Simkaniaceae bacterium]|nr:hypothetical protein [Simkaniaceae bacterium]